MVVSLWNACAADLALPKRCTTVNPTLTDSASIPSLECANQLAERVLNLRRERQLRRLRGSDDLRAGHLLHGGSDFV